MTTFIKQVPLHLRNRLKRVTKDINNDMSTVNYVDDDVNIDDLSDAETVNYTNNATVKTPKKKYDAITDQQNKKKHKNLKRKTIEKNKLATSNKNKTKR